MVTAKSTGDAFLSKISTSQSEELEIYFKRWTSIALRVRNACVDENDSVE